MNEKDIQNKETQIKMSAVIMEQQIKILITELSNVLLEKMPKEELLTITPASLLHYYGIGIKTLAEEFIKKSQLVENEKVEENDYLN